MRAVWDKVGERFYETGCDRGMLYLQKDGIYPNGVPWNGLSNVTENPSGAEDNKVYADNIPYLNIKSAEEFGVTIECYTVPDEWGLCDGTAEFSPGIYFGQQTRHTFGLAYRTKIGNDTAGSNAGHKLHLVYGCSASTSEKSYSTVNDNPEATAFSYEATSIPVPVEGKDEDGNEYSPVSIITIDSRTTPKEIWKKIEDTLWGTDGEGDNDDGTNPRLPLPDDFKEIIAAG